ncbi:MAG: hypothetical protein U0R18_21190 [Mycobacterium sp.]
MSSNEEPEVIDVEAVEVEDSDDLPAVIATQAETKSRPNAEEASSTHSHKDSRTRAQKRLEETDELGRTWRDKRLEENETRRCTAHLSDGSGERCRKWAIRGGTTCATHGSGTKAAKLAARERLDNAADRMAKELLKIALTADSESVALAAVRDALDRTIGKAPTTVEIGASKPYEAVFDGISALPLDGTSFAEPSLPTETGPTQPTQPDPTTQPCPSARTNEKGSDPQQPHWPAAPVRHITGEDAIRIANETNRAAGVFEQKAIEGPHKRYPRP